VAWVGYAMVLFKDRRQANPAMEKLEKWGAASRPDINLVIGSLCFAPRSTESTLGNSRVDVRLNKNGIAS
jgi:hypothetical protein